jgi:tRNA-splicing ligase RtcB
MQISRPKEHARFQYEVSRETASGKPLKARVFADEELIAQIQRDKSLEQLMNVSTLPGLSGLAYGMPDMHEGYGFPVGGVAATRVPDGVISPGGIGFDINCGVRLLASNLVREDVEPLTPLVHELSRAIPTGYGRHGRLQMTPREMEELLNHGCPYLVERHRQGTREDLDFIESRGALPGADAGKVSQRAKERGHDQLGTLGCGNHFLEVQVVERVYDEQAAQALGLFKGQIVVLIHSGSRGLGHQVCSDYVKRMDQSLKRYAITLPDRQLACAPIDSPEGRDYLAAMNAAANFAWCNRQALTQRVREAFSRVLGDKKDTQLRLVYDVAHNIAKFEPFDGHTLCVHRKGATRAFGPGQPAIPPVYRALGQPVMVPGDMGRASYVLVGADGAMEKTFGSACHGAGRALSRHAALKAISGPALQERLQAQGIIVRGSWRGLAEETPEAYKDVDHVVEVVHQAGIAFKVARVVPMGVIKG